MTLCNDCNDTGRPQFHGQTVFKGDFKEPSCEECGATLTDN